MKIGVGKEENIVFAYNDWGIKLHCGKNIGAGKYNCMNFMVAEDFAKLFLEILVESISLQTQHWVLYLCGILRRMTTAYMKD